MKQIIVFGANGGTGKEVVQQALEKGHKVTAVIRNPAAFDIKHLHLKIIKGDVFDTTTFKNEIDEKTAVISCLGSGTTKPTTLYSEGIQNIISAMKKHDAKRLICISAGALYTNKEMGFFIRMLTKLVLQKILKAVYADMRMMEKIVKKSGLEWTIIRPPMLKNKVMTGNYRIAVRSHIKRPFSIARADLAHFIINHLNDDNIYQSIVEIAY